MTATGFTIIELAVALTIVSLIIGSLAVPLGTRIAEQQYTDTQNSIDKAVEALVGFAALNGRLPCPDMRTADAVADNRDGAEDPRLEAGLIIGCNAGFGGTNSDAGNASWGDLPWQTLGLQAPNNQDAWNNRLRYAVFEPLTHAPPVFPASLGAANLDIRCGNPTSLPPTVGAAFVPAPGCLPIPVANPYQVSANAVFVVYSHGTNAWGSTNILDVTTARPFLAPIPINDETANTPENDAAALFRRQFVTRARSEAESNSGEFDDLLSYMSATTFAAKMLSAGRFP